MEVSTLGLGRRQETYGLSEGGVGRPMPNTGLSTLGLGRGPETCGLPEGGVGRPTPNTGSDAYRPRDG